MSETLVRKMACEEMKVVEEYRARDATEGPLGGRQRGT